MSTRLNTLFSCTWRDISVAFDAMNYSTLCRRAEMFFASAEMHSDGLIFRLSQTTVVRAVDLTTSLSFDRGLIQRRSNLNVSASTLAATCSSKVYKWVDIWSIFDKPIWTRVWCFLFLTPIVWLGSLSAFAAYTSYVKPTHYE